MDVHADGAEAERQQRALSVAPLHADAAGLPSAACAWRHNLPPQPSALLGRDAERIALAAALLDPDVRLLTLTGPGGTGKTRLAIAVAEDVLDAFGGEVCWIDLACIETPERVVPTIAQTLGVHETGGLSPWLGLLRALHDRAILLVLDNFEHVLRAAVDLSALLESCPRTKLLVTSREPLLLRWEREVPVAPLGLPAADDVRDPGTAVQAPAVSLFVERAQEVTPGFQLTAHNVAAVVDLCTRLDGLPLAIELAAARMRVLSPAALLARLGQRLEILRRNGPDVPPRHRTLAAAIGWSYGLLTHRERMLFRSLGVFGGGASLEAIEAVSFPGGADLLEPLGALVEKNLVQRVAGPESTSRFRLLETIRAFALAELETFGEERHVRRCHALYFLELAERAEAGILGGEQARWFARVELELSNFRAALRWLIDAPEPELAARLGSAMMAFWFPRGHFLEARAWLFEVLDVAGLPAALPARITSLARLGALIAFQGDGVGGGAMTAEALSLARQLGNPFILGQAAQSDGMAALARADWAAARAAFEEARVCMSGVGNWFWEAFAEDYLGLVAAQEGALSEAAALISASLDRRRAGGDQWGEAESLERLGLLNLRRGAVGPAAKYLSASLQLRQVLEDKLGLARGLESLAAVAAQRGQVVRAITLLGAAERLRDALGAIVLPTELPIRELALTVARLQLDENAIRSAWTAGRALPLARAILLAVEPQPSAPMSTARSGAKMAGPLSPREREVAGLIAQGRTSHEIAQRLVISHRTADAHVEHIRAKLGLRSRADIAAWAVAHGLPTTRAARV